MDVRTTLITCFSLLFVFIPFSDSRIQIPTLDELLFTQERDYGAPAPQLITSRGFGYEVHYFVSQDGFINAMHRIINPKFPVTRSVVLFFHSLAASSNIFLSNDDSGDISEPDDFVGNNIGFELAKRGHDVWLLDQRATPFSSNHTIYSKFEKGYWDWSLDEIALLDLSAAIDYVRRCTGRHQIGYIAHSQGTQVMLMLLAKIPKYNDYIRPCILMAPVFYLGASPVSSFPDLPLKLLETTFKSFGGPLSTSIVQTIARDVCRPKQNLETCKLLAYMSLIIDSLSMLPILPMVNYQRTHIFVTSGLSYTTSAKVMAQNIQMVRSKVPQMISYSPDVNKKLYGTQNAPIYDPRRITCKSLVLFSAASDTIAPPKAVQWLRDRLPVKPLVDYAIKEPTFGHAGFTFGHGSQIVPLVIRPIIRLLDQVN